MTAEAKGSNHESSPEQIILEAMEACATTGETTKFYSLEWGGIDLAYFSTRHTPISSLGGSKPKDDKPDSISHAHIHFQVASEVPERERYQYPHRVDIDTYPTAYSDKGVFWHEADYGNGRKVVVIGPRNLSPVEVVA